MSIAGQETYTLCARAASVTTSVRGYDIRQGMQGLRAAIGFTGIVSGTGALSVSGSAGVAAPAINSRLPKTMYGTMVAPVAVPKRMNPGAPMAPNFPT
jgi:hypothetical protein